MKKIKILMSVLCFIIFTVFCPLIALSQKLPQLGSGVKTDAPSYAQMTIPATDEEIDKNISQLQARIAGLRAQSPLQYDRQIAAGGLVIATPEELSKAERLAGQLISALDRHVRLLNELREVRRINRDHAAERKTWRGFSEKPPFPISFLDGIYDDIVIQRSDKERHEMRKSIAVNDLQRFTKDLKESRKQLRLASEQRERSAGGIEGMRKRWLEDLAQLQSDFNEAGAVFAEASRLVLEEAIRGREEYISFLVEKLRVAQPNTPFTREEFDQKIRGLSALRRSVATELEIARKNDEEGKKKVQSLRDALSRAQNELKPGEIPPDKQAGRIGLLRSSLDAEQVFSETAAARISTLLGIMMLTDIAQTIWEDRFWLRQEPHLAGIRERGNALKQSMVNVHLWRKFIDERISTWVALVRSQEEKLTRANETDTQRRIDQLVLSAYKERLAMLLKLVEHLSQIEMLAERLDYELAQKKEHPSPRARIRDSLETALSFFSKIWNEELYVAEEATIVEGKKIVKAVSVTIGKAIKAIFILVVGTLIARRLTKPVRWMITRKLGKEENVAQQIGKVSFLFMFIIVLVFSLVTVNIPLGVFAFFGGALAIGIGFGAQNLINNFISGLILLFDRSIRVGDVVEIDNQSGRVTEIGMRSSLIRRFDGVELLVPNSQFLQQKVTNWTLTERNVRYAVSVGVAYGSPTQEVSAAILRTVEAHPSVLKTPSPMVLFEDFAESALTFTVYFWLELISTRDNRIAVSEIRHAINEALSKSGIVIAFPQRDVHIDAQQPIEVKVVGSGQKKDAN